ncbi:MAG: AAA family ATPase [Candidatus Paceibacterota bacterium]|jgi:hypothetical protein
MQTINKNLITQEEFIMLFPNTRFRYIHDVNGSTIQGNNILDMSWNEKGYGIFFTVNGFPSTGKADQSQLLSLNGNYVDFDVDAKFPQEEKEKLIKEAIMSGIEAGIPTPTIINRTQKGAHLIWLYTEILKPTLENIAKWKDVQKRLVHCFNGDTAATDPSRVLRMPYSLHLKDPNNPFEIKVMSYKPEARCTLEELEMTVPRYSENEVDKDKISAIELLLKGVPIGKGLRHGALAQIAGLFLKGADTPEKVEIARMNYYDWDKKVVGSPERFEERKKELDNTFNGILKREVSGEDTEIKTKFDIANRPRLWTIGEILEHDFGEEEWLVDSLISKQGMMALSGNPGDFKTWVTIHIALCVSRNLPVFGKFQATQGSVLIIDEEDHLRLLKRRLELLGAKEADNIHYLSQSGIKIDIEVVRDMILDIVNEKNIKLVIFDSLIRVHGQEENDAGGMAKVFNSFQKIITAGASILFTHHHRKQQQGQKANTGQSMRGSSDILAAVDCHITIEKKSEEEDRLILRQTKLRQGELLPPFEISILKSELGPSGFEFVGDFDEKKKKAEEASDAVVILLAEGMKNRPEIIELLKDDDYGRDIADRGIKIAEEAGKIEKVPKDEVPKGDRKAYYRLPWLFSIRDVPNELPASLPPIEGEKQEDVQNEPFEEVERDKDGIEIPQKLPGQPPEAHETDSDQRSF